MNETTPFACTIGLDWADQKHDLWICPAGSSKSEHLRLDQTPEALHEWVAKLRARFDNQPVAIGIETSRGPVISGLLAYDFIVLFPVNPKALKDYRAAFSVSGAKDDRTDAMLLEEWVRLHRDKLKALEPDTELTRKLAGLVENRRRLVDERCGDGVQQSARVLANVGQADVAVAVQREQQGLRRADHGDAG